MGFPSVTNVIVRADGELLNSREYDLPQISIFDRAGEEEDVCRIGTETYGRGGSFQGEDVLVMWVSLMMSVSAPSPSCPSVRGYIYS